MPETKINANQINGSVSSESLRELELTAMAVKLSLEDGVLYKCTTPLSSLIIDSIPEANAKGIELHFKTNTNFSNVAIPSGTKYAGAIPTWKNSFFYIIKIKNNILQVFEINITQ